MSLKRISEIELVIYIPTYNRKEKLSNSIAIISKEIIGFEDFVRVFVSNNGSSDGTADFLKGCNQEWLIKRNAEFNQSGFLNIIAGYDLPISTKFVWMIGDDDYLLPNAIKDLIYQIRSHPEVDVIFCNTTAFPNNNANEIMSRYLNNQEIGTGNVKSNYFKNIELVDFEKLVDPRIADTLLGELMVICFKQEKFRFQFENAKSIYRELNNLCNRDDSSLIAEGMLRQPHNLALFENIKSTTPSLYLPEPKTFNFWGSAEWLGDYNYIFPVIMMYLLTTYKEKLIINEDKYTYLLKYYFSLFQNVFPSQLNELTNCKKFNSKIKSEFLSILFDFCLRKKVFNG